MMEYLKALYLKIARKELDHFDVITEGAKLGIDFREATEFVHERALLLNAVLKEILKDENGEERSKYQEQFDTNVRILNRKRAAKVKCYQCPLVGCLFTARTHRSYVAHLERIHARNDQFTCFYRQKCPRNFSSTDLLNEHFERDHLKRQPAGEDVTNNLNARGQILFKSSCRCNMLSCGEMVFKSVSDLASHMNTAHRDEPRECIFRDCDVKFKPKSVSRNHFRQKHYTSNKVALKSVHLMKEAQIQENENYSDQNEEEQLNQVNDDDYSMENDENGQSEDGDDSVDIEGNNEDEMEHLFMMSYANFVNRLVNFKFIPVTSVQEIASEFLSQSLRSQKERATALRSSLLKIPNLSHGQIEEIIEENARDPFIHAQEELASEFKRAKFLEENFHFVRPIEIILNPEEVKYGARKEVVHYVPIMEALKVLVEDKSFIQATENFEEKKVGDDGTIKDVKDGEKYKNSQYFQDNPQALALMLYSDGVELTNPLGSGKGKHKIVQLFWSVSEIPKFQRSAIDRLQLGMIFKEKFLKKYSHAKIFKSLVEDLLVLESEGFEVKEPVEMRMKAGVLLYSADNLEAHIIGGFSSCFSSKDICRWCHCQYKDLEDHVHDFDGDSVHRSWNAEEYDQHDVPEVEDETACAIDEETAENLFTEFSDPERIDDIPDEEANDAQDGSNTNFGVKTKCVFNALNAFHCTSSMPPDSLHDLMEGVLPQDLLGIVRILVNKGWFSLAEYNKALKSIKYSRQESSNKPQEVTSSNKVKKLAGKATSNWVHCRLFSYILMINGWVLDKEDPVLLLALKLSDITDRLTAEAFRPHEIDILEDLIVEYLDLRKQIYIEYPIIGRPKPKHHFLTHYGAAIRNFGPPSSYWTGRYESKHRVAKSLAEASKNFINISHTVSHRQQLRMLSTYYEGMFSCSEFKLPIEVKSRNDLSDSGLEKTVKQFMSSAGDLVCSEIEFKCRKFKEGDLVILDRHDLLQMEVGLIKGFLVRKEEIFIIAKKCIADQNFLRVFESSFISSNLEMVNIVSLQDQYPLLKRGTDEKFVFLQHHHVSFSYN